LALLSTAIFYFTNPPGIFLVAEGQFVTSARDYQSDSNVAVTWRSGKLWSLANMLKPYAHNYLVKEAMRYAAQRDQKKLARQAMDQWEKVANLRTKNKHSSG
jgi:hypothetical protein